MDKIWLCALPILVLLTGCPHIIGGSGEGVSLSAVVSLKNEDGTVAANEPVYVHERIGSRQRTTVVTSTDENGRITLEGHFCAPIVIAASGGSVSIHVDTVKSSYSITLPSDRRVGVESASKLPVLDPVFNRPRRYESCGWPAT